MTKNSNYQQPVNLFSAAVFMWGLTNLYTNRSESGVGLDVDAIICNLSSPFYGLCLFVLCLLTFILRRQYLIVGGRVCIPSAPNLMMFHREGIESTVRI